MYSIPYSSLGQARFMDTTNANTPTVLRQFLSRGQPQHQHQQMHTDQSAYATYGHQSATSSATTLQNSAASSTRLAPAKSMGNLRSGSTLGAWLSKYHLRPGGARPSAKSALGADASDASLPRTSISNDHALSAYITSVETSEANGSGGSGELRVGGLRMGRKRFLIYRVLVTGHTGQWWVARRYSEFHELYQLLRRHFPQRAHLWGEFPSKRLLPGLSSSADSVMQRRERLNAFLRAINQDPEVTNHSATQQFLREGPLDVDAIPLAERAAGEKETALQRDFGTIETLAHTSHAPLQQTGTKRSVSSGSVLPSIDSLNMKAPWHTQLATQWSSGGLPPPVPRTRESIERMASMPMLKSDGARRPNFDFSVPLPAQPPSANFTSLSATTAHEAGDRQLPESKAPAQMIRKISDPLEYASVEKRPNNVMPQAMRKKYGFRRNIQYRNGRYETKNRGASSSQPQIPLPPPPDTGDTLMEQDMIAGHGNAMNWESEYVMVDDNDSGNMDVDLTLRGGSVDSELDASTRSLHAANLGRKLAALRRAPLGGIGKNRATPSDDLAVSAAKARLRGGKRQHMAVPDAEQDALDYDEDADGAGRPPKPPTQQKVGLDDFQLLSIIGKGSYGKVMLARYKDSGRIMAIKVISKSKLRGRPSEIRRVMSERKVLERTVRHPFLVGLQCAFQTKEQLFFCLDYVNGGELFFHLQRERRFGENRARFYAAEIISALAYLHGMDVVYRDLKPENCLLDARGHVRIVDFGLAKEVGPVVWRTEGSALYSVEEGGKTNTFCGTPEYLAPEVLLRRRYGKEVDWYCLGAVLYEMLTGLPPFYDQDNNTMYQRILSEDLRFPASLPPPAACNGMMSVGSGNVAGGVVGRYAQDFVFRIMQRDPEQRLGHGVFGTENVKRHVFFHGIDWGKIYRQEYAPPFVPKVSSIFDLSNIDPEFRNEPIPESILYDGQVDILAEAAEAEHQADLDLQAQLMAFPSPVNSPTAKKHFADSRNNPVSLRAQNGLMASIAKGHANADLDSTINAFRGFSFVSPFVDKEDAN
ncbi:kinase-like protein [Coemansia reversa NRRL 1564]|uniref:Kinase-like protein n=1 Tax=Coemansia reversa (strain ATCC 12441 / NRRL 1564) TaxID=763665 RepID=A0A2G5BAL4_COERN|nr:kinase-like protein [Coemansia reversa NRRL 1564]|eukprot:PIA16056.1 kinase-like protein [Coemansia reversa NRRL 1564]